MNNKKNIFSFYLLSMAFLFLAMSCDTERYLNTKDKIKTGITQYKSTKEYAETKKASLFRAETAFSILRNNFEYDKETKTYLPKEDDFRGQSVDEIGDLFYDSLKIATSLKIPHTDNHIKLTVARFKLFLDSVYGVLFVDSDGKEYQSKYSFVGNETKSGIEGHFSTKEFKQDYDALQRLYQTSDMGTLEYDVALDNIYQAYAPLYFNTTR